jgi:hypothetical protein
MANRSGGASVADVGRLQEARVGLERQLGFPVRASIGKDLRLLAFPVTRSDRERLQGVSRWAGFPVEVRDAPIKA